MRGKAVYCGFYCFSVFNDNVNMSTSNHTLAWISVFTDDTFLIMVVVVGSCIHGVLIGKQIYKLHLLEIKLKIKQN